MKAILKQLIAAYGPSGREQAARALIQDTIRPYVDEMRVDALGNLIARKKGDGPRIMLSAHMDQIGFVVTEADERGFLRVNNVGYPRRVNSINRRVVFEDGSSGILSREIEENDPKDTTMQRLFIDIGATSRAEALSRVSIGDMAVYAADWAELGEDLIAAPAMDDRAGCALLIGVLRVLKNPARDVYAVFSTQEEVGLRGAKAAAYDVDPDEGIALDVTPTGDTPKGERLPVKAGGGIAIKVLDSSVICAPEVVEALERTAEAAGIKYQREVLTHGGTDAGAIHMTRAGVPSGALSIPCRYVHSACEVISMSDLAAGAALLTAYLEKDAAKA